MSYNIRLEKKEDYNIVENLVREAFWNVYRPGCYEHYVLHVLRDDDNFVKELDFVMEKDGKIIGQNVFMKTHIDTDDGNKLEVLTMGPICISPEYKRQGFGKILLDYSLKKAAELGFGVVLFEGNINFYKNCGFDYAKNFDIRYHDLPEGEDSSFFICRELIKGYLDNVKGEYQTPQAYYVSEEDVEKFDKNFPYKTKLKLPGQIFNIDEEENSCVYLDNAATTLYKPEVVIDAVTKAMRTQGNASRGAHGATLSASRMVYESRVKIAEFFNFDDPARVIFTSNSTEALNIAINGIVKNNDKVITTDTEHNSVLRPLYHLRNVRNIDLQFVNADKNGILDMKQFEQICDNKTKVVVVNHISNLTGNANDIKAISKIAHKVGAILIVDGSQSAGTRKVDLKELNIDVYCFTGHKSLFGPQGTGGLLIKDGIEIEPWKRGGSGVKTYEEEQPSEYPTRLEAGTLNSHGLAGLSSAIDYLNEVGIENIEKKEKELTKYFYNKVSKIDGIKIYGDFSTIDKELEDKNLEHSAIVSLNIKDYDSGEISDILSNDYNIATRSGAHCAPRLHIALGTKYQGAVRFSFSYMTTFEELDVVINALREIAK